MTVTSSMPFSEKRPLKLCELYEQAAYTARCARKGDWVEFRFEEPLNCQYIEVITGFYQVFRRLIYNGHVELSYDGRTFENAGLLHNGKIELRPTRTVYALRIVADGITDAEEYTVIRPLKIK
jgi:hexosaminidase